MKKLAGFPGLGLVLALVLLLVFFGVKGGAQAGPGAEGPGLKTDPLVSKSYVQEQLAAEFGLLDHEVEGLLRRIENVARDLEYVKKAANYN